MIIMYVCMFSGEKTSKPSPKKQQNIVIFVLNGKVQTLGEIGRKYWEGDI